jgi:valyl-tRNA synthetase
VILRGRKFANKIWNASGLLFSKLPNEPKRESLADRWIGSRLNTAIDRANKAFEHHRYHEAADAVWTFFWDEFCDWYLELKKSDTDWGFAYQVHEKAMLLLHPLMPFITEELWHRRGHETSIALEAYPQYDPALHDPDAEREMRALTLILTGIRQRRVEQKIDRKQQLTVYGRAQGEWFGLLAKNASGIMRLENLMLDIEDGSPSVRPTGLLGSTGSQVIWGCLFEGQEICTLGFEVPKALGASDEQKERLKKDSEQLEKIIANSLRQLGNESFVAKAPSHVIDGMRAKLAEYQAQLAQNQAALSE